MLFGNFFGQKVKHFKTGVRNTFTDLLACRKRDKPLIWFHVSSLGEYEQALPLIEEIKNQHPEYQVVLSFFSPSGYEVKKDKTPADCVFYLPVDTPANARKLLDILQPEKVFFVKYDLWPNYLLEIKKRAIPAYLVSALFTSRHSFFKPYNKWLKGSLGAFKIFFAQDENTQKVLHEQGFDNVVIAGDTRFDRVYQIAQKSEKLDFVEKFKQDFPLLVAGSTWPKDEELLLPYINETPLRFKTIIAPHEVHRAHVDEIIKALKKPYILYSDIQPDTDLSKYEVLILNTIGLLNKIYRYAGVVYIGNGFGKSIHNIQEPAVYGVPIITGPHIEKFKEAVDLHQSGGLVVVNNAVELQQILDELFTDETRRQKMAEITRNYALQNVGATKKIVKHL